MPHRTVALALALALALVALAAPSAAQDASGAAITGDDATGTAAQAQAVPPARVAIELGDVEIKVRSLRVTVTLDPEDAAALGEALTGAALRAGAESTGE